MFCERCGKELREEWSVCPNCGEKIYTTDQKIEVSEKFQTYQDDTGEIQHGSARIVLKILTIISFVCFFCPLYMVSCAGQEIATISGPDLMLGFQYMGEEIEGSFVYGVLGLFPLWGMCAALANRKKLSLLKEYEKIKGLFYEVAVAGGATVIVNYCFTGALKSSFQETIADIESCMALDVMTIVSMLLLLIAGYQMYKLELYKKEYVNKGITAVKCLGKILAGCAGSVIVVFVIIYASGGLQQDNVVQEYSSEISEIYEEQNEESTQDKEDYNKSLEEEQERQSVQDNSDEVYIFPNSDSKYLSEDEVRSVEVENLLLGRNEIFARHGYIFKNEDLNRYFENTSWYEGTITSDKFNADEIFNDFEKKNVELIKQIENEVNNKVNNKGQSFVGMTGVYICMNTTSNDMTGKIQILSVNENSLEFELGTLDMSYSMLSGQAEIIDANTAIAEEDGIRITFTWSDAENMVVTHSGEIGDWMDAAIIDEVTDNQAYTRPLEFNQW